LPRQATAAQASARPVVFGDSNPRRLRLLAGKAQAGSAMSGSGADPRYSLPAARRPGCVGGAATV